MSNFAFKFAQPDTVERSVKPRSKGQTVMMDYCIPVGAQQDWLDVIGPSLDIAKLVTGTASLYEEDYLKRKLELYDRYDVNVLIGGNFLESIFDRYGFDGAEQLFDECMRLGIGTIEVSATVVPMRLEERLALVEKAKVAGLGIHAEVGTKISKSSIDQLVGEVETLLDAGVDNIAVEGFELMNDGIGNQELCDRLAESFDLDKILFELCGPWLDRTHSWETYSLMRFLIGSIGPHVNISNATPQMVVEIEATRRGLHE